MTTKNKTQAKSTPQPKNDELEKALKTIETLKAEKEELANDRDILKAKVDELEALFEAGEGVEDLEDISDEDATYELPVKLEPYMFLVAKPNNVRAKITCIHPAGHDPNHPYNRYQLDVDGAGKLTLNETLVRALFADTGVIGTFTETFEQAVERLEGAENGEA